MTIEVQSALIGSFVTVAVMMSMLLRRRQRRTDILFAVLSVILVLWFIATFLHGTYGADPWMRVELGFAALAPAALLKLFTDLVPGSSARGRQLMGAAYPLSAVVAVVAISPLGDLKAAQYATQLYIATVILLGSRTLIQSTDISKGTVDHVRRRYLAIGASATTILAIVGGFPQLGGIATAIGHLAVMIYVFFLSQVILRDRLLDLNEFVGRMMVLGILAVLFAVISAVLVGLGSNASSRLFNAIVGVIIILTLYEPLKDLLEAKTVELFFRDEPHLFAEALEHLRRRMQHGVIEPSRMSSIVLDALYDARRATHAAIYLPESMGSGFELHSFRGPEPAPRVNAQDLPALWHAIQKNRAPILTEHLTREGGQRQGSSSQDLIDGLRAVSADVLLPFVSGDMVLGFLSIRDDRSPEPYSTHEIANLMKVAETAATVIWNSRLAERLRERERLAAIGAMAAGLAHEIRNPLGAIKGAAQYLDPGKFVSGEEAELLQVIVDESNRLNLVVSQFLDYARPFRPNFQPTDINEVARRTAKLVETREKDRPTTPIELELDENLPLIDADTEQVKQVILNLVLNGVEATEASGGPVKITTRFVPERDRIELRVIDRGSGISREDLERIFIPFFTTKSHGTGLGLAVCHRIVTNHGGTIHPETQIGRGTEFVIRLPVRRQDAASTTGSFGRPIPSTNTPS